MIGLTYNLPWLPAVLVLGFTALAWLKVKR